MAAINMFGIHENRSVEKAKNPVENIPKQRKKRKTNFDFLFPAPEKNENMGMDIW